MGVHADIAPVAEARTDFSNVAGAMPAAVADPHFLTYLHSRFSSAAEERLHVVYCDGLQRYLHDETLMIGGEHSLVLRARPLVHRALMIGAETLILAHNHLSGQCQPSVQDIRATHRLQKLGAALELRLIDHMIFTRDRFFSMAAAGMLTEH